MRLLAAKGDQLDDALVVTSRRQRIEEPLGIEPSGLDDFPDLYNITPGVETSIARVKDGKPELDSYLWGLVPYWSKDPKKGARPVNARAETAHEKPMFRKLIRGSVGV